MKKCPFGSRRLGSQPDECERFTRFSVYLLTELSPHTHVPKAKIQGPADFQRAVHRAGCYGSREGISAGIVHPLLYISKTESHHKVSEGNFKEGFFSFSFF